MNDIMNGGVSMYFPILKGGIFELSALTELLVNKRLNDKIIPIIEPVRITPTLLKTLELFVENNREIAIILNSQRCDFNCLLKEMILENSTVAKALATVMKSPYIIKAYIMNENIELEIKHKADKKDYIIIIESADSLSSYLEVYEDCCPRYTFMPNDKACKCIFSKNRILLLNNQTETKDDMIFCNHLSYYKKDGFVGISDFSLKERYRDAMNFHLFPKLIHFTYLDSNMSINIHRFISNDHGRLNDLVVTFKELVSDLIIWNKANKMYDTLGFKAILECYHMNRYPGFCVMKIYLIMHHLELMSFFIKDMNTIMKDCLL